MPTPKKGESADDFVSRCVRVRQHEHPDESQKQSVAVCYSMHRKAKKQQDKLARMRRT